MKLLGHRGDEHRLDPLPLEHHLLIVESQHRVAEQHQPRIGIHVASTSSRRAVMLEAVELDDETVTDQEVDRVPVDPHLLTDADAEAAESREEDRLQARVAQRGTGIGDFASTETPPVHSSEHTGLDQSATHGGLPHRQRQIPAARTPRRGGAR